MGDSSSRQRLSSEANQTYVQGALREVTAVFTDNKNIQSEVSHYGAGFLKTAALFMPGKIGLAGSIIIGGLDQAKPNESSGSQVADFALGGLKGAGMRAVMHAMGSERLPGFISQSPAAKGVAFGISNRLLDTALTRQNYLDANGNFDGGTFGANVWKSVANPQALISDAATFVVAQGLVSSVTKFKPQFFESSPLAQTMATSASFGLSNGAAGEIMRQQDAHEKFDLSKVIGRSLLQGGVDALAGGPGGLRANAIARSASAPESMVTEPTSKSRPLIFQGSEKMPISRFIFNPEREPGSTRQPAAAQIADNDNSNIPGEFFSSYTRPDGNQHVNFRGENDTVNRLVEAEKGLGETPDAQLIPPEQKAGFIGPLETREATLRDLTIPERSLERQPNRVVGYKTGVENWPERSAHPGPFNSFDDFYYHGVDRNPIDVRYYSVSGHRVQVILPERYGAALDDNAAGKPVPTGAQDLSQRLSPQDLPALLDAMPNSGYFVKINMSDRRNPEDAWVSQSGYNADFRTAMSMTEGEMTTYMTDRSDYMRRDVLHEWSHELRYEYWDHAIAYRFRNAVDLEKDWNPSTYAGRNNGEQWAVLGERMLGNNASEFLDAAEHAPLRTVVWMRALKLCLDNVPEENKSVDHDLYRRRQDYVEKEILPLAVEKLNNVLKTGTEDQQKWASDLLGYFKSEGLIQN
ncbi:hypothetical protein BH10CYA1_BH10CYA1_60760 [soil metagenome]